MTYFNSTKSINCQIRLLYRAKLLFKTGRRIRTFQNKLKLKQSCQSSQHYVLKGILYTEKEERYIVNQISASRGERKEQII